MNKSNQNLNLRLTGDIARDIETIGERTNPSVNARVRAAAARLRQQEAKIDALAHETKQALAERDAVKRQLRIATADRDDVWFWENSGESHHESILCPVVMSAETLRDLLRAAGRSS